MTQNVLAAPTTVVQQGKIFCWLIVPALCAFFPFQKEKKKQNKWGKQTNKKQWKVFFLPKPPPYIPSQNLPAPSAAVDANKMLQEIYNSFPFNGGKTYVRLDISASSRDLYQQTDDPACWLAEVTVEDSSQSRVQN
jgi:hypothetical protein